MSKKGGKIFIKYRDPVAASFSSKDIIFNVQSGTIFYKRNRKLHSLRGTPDGFDLVVFPGQSDSSQYQILINDQGTMTGTEEFQFKPASATCGCCNYFTLGVDTLTHFSGSVRIGEQLPSSCNILDGHFNPALKVYGNLQVTENPSANMAGHITASGYVSCSITFYGQNAYINNTIYQMLIHKKCKKKKSMSGKAVKYSLNSLRMIMPLILSNKIEQYKKNKNFLKIRRAIVIYKERIKTNFGN